MYSTVAEPEKIEKAQANVPQKTKDEIDEAKLIDELKKDVSNWDAYYAANIQKYKEDTYFVYDEERGQWSNEAIAEYDADNKPHYTFNMLVRYINNIMGEFTERIPYPKVRPTSSQNDNVKKIQLYTGILREICYSSNYDQISESALHDALAGGFGVFMYEVERENDHSFNYAIRRKYIHDPTMAGFDPAARHPNKGDGRYFFLRRYISKDEYKAKYPEKPIPSGDNGLIKFDSDNTKWIDENNIAVVDLWKKKPIKKRMVLLDDGQVMEYDQYKQLIDKLSKMSELAEKVKSPVKIPPVPRIVKEEEMNSHYIQFYRFTLDHVLETRKWDGKYLPGVFQPGYIRWVKGRENTFSFIRFVKDAQKAYNYARTENLYRLQLTRYEPFMVTDKMIAGGKDMESQWKNAHKAKGALVFKPDQRVGNAFPQLVQHAQIPTSLITEIQQSKADLQDIPGRYEANLGGPSNETSGVAIARRQLPSNMAVKLFFENARLAEQWGMNIVLDLIPKIYDTTREINIMTKDKESKLVQINTDADNTLDTSDFEVTIDLGESFKMQRQEANDQLVSLTGQDVSGKLLHCTADLIAQNLDIENAPQLVERIQKNYNPDVIAMEKDDPAVKAQMQAQQAQQQQQQQMMQQLQMMLVQMKAQDEHLKAIAAQMSAKADIMNAETKRAEIEVNAATKARQLETEDHRTAIELTKEMLKPHEMLEKLLTNPMRGDERQGKKYNGSSPM